MELSLILPALNEEKTIGLTLKNVKEILSKITTYEIIVVDSDSKDKTVSIAKKHGAVVVNEPKRGYSNALKKGFSVAKGKYVIMYDPDGTYDVRTLSVIIQKLREGYDYVNANRFANLKPGAMSFKHRFGNRVINHLGNLFFGAKGHDVLSGYKGFKASALKRLDIQSEKWDFNIEVHSKIKRYDLKFIEIPTTYFPRKGQSKLTGAFAAWCNIKYMLLHNPNVIFIYPSIFLLILGLVGMSFSLLTNILGFISLLVFTMFLVFGLQMFLFGISAKNYLVEKGFEKRSVLSTLGSNLTFERGLITGVSLFCLSGLIFIYLVIKRLSTHALELNDIKSGVLGFGLLSMSVSIIIYSFINQILSE